MKAFKIDKMFWIFVVSIGTAVLAVLSGFLQYREKLSSTQKSLKKEQELNNVYKQLQEKSNEIIDSTNEILLLNKELRKANELIVKIQQEQGEGFKKKDKQDEESNFNQLKRTTSDLNRLSPFKRKYIEESTLQEQTQFIAGIQSLLSREVSNPYLIKKDTLFKKWVDMYQLASIYTRTFPTEDMTEQNGKEIRQLNSEELLQFNKKEFKYFLDKYYEFMMFMSHQTKGLWF